MFRITSSRGFQIEFPNGLTLSTQFGGGHYCENRDMPILIGNGGEDVKSKNVEIAIFIMNKPGSWHTRKMMEEVFPEIQNNDDVWGHVSLGDWLKVLDWCKNHKL